MPTTQAPARSATIIPAADIEATMAAAPTDSVSDQSIRMIDAGDYNLGVGLVRRPAAQPGGPIVHHAQAEIYRVVEGAGTLVTGGTLVDAQPLAADSRVVTDLTGPSSIGSRIEGGRSRPVAAGDMVIIPAGVPHGFSALSSDIAYVVVRVDPDQLVRLK